jgi:hypothetical protein
MLSTVLMLPAFRHRAAIGVRTSLKGCKVRESMTVLEALAGPVSGQKRL